MYNQKGLIIMNKKIAFLVILGLFFILGSALAKENFSNAVKEATAKGIEYGKAGKYDEAITELNKAIELDPRFVPAYANRALAYQGKGKLNLAIDDCTKAIELDSKYIPAYINRGTIYGAKGDYDSAIADFEKAIKLKPDDAMAYYSRALAYYYKKDYNKSWDDVHKVEKLGYKINPTFLDYLKKASNREK